MTKPLPKIAPCPWPGCQRKPETDLVFVLKCDGYFVICSDDPKTHEVAGPVRATEAAAVNAWNKAMGKQTTKRGRK